MEEIENHMVVDGIWTDYNSQYMEREPGFIGFQNISTNECVPIEDALIYAREHIRQREDETDTEFLEWYFSGNWVHER